MLSARRRRRTLSRAGSVKKKALAHGAEHLSIEEHEGKRNDGKGGSCNNLRGCVLEEEVG